VEVDHELVKGRLAKQQRVEVDHFLRLVVEEIDLSPDRAGILALSEEPLAGLGCAQVFAVLPKPDADAVGLRVVDQLAELGVGPALPEALDDVVLEPQFAR
jgi:hypothetical protein